MHGACEAVNYGDCNSLGDLKWKPIGVDDQFPVK
jgi:hypothetical protein